MKSKPHGKFMGKSWESRGGSMGKWENPLEN
jgi:hypothetical protein